MGTYIIALVVGAVMGGCLVVCIELFLDSPEERDMDGK
jgi:hypothetical protein